MMLYGAEGYALYWYCIELIAARVAPDNITFELKHDAEVIGYHLKIDTLKVEKIMVEMVNMGLFEQDDGRITCMKLAKRLDNTLTQNKELKATLSNFNSLKAEEKRRDEKRIDKNRDKDKDKDKDCAGKKTPAPSRFVKPSLSELNSLITEKGYIFDAEAFVNFYESKGWMIGKNKMRSWRAAAGTWNTRLLKEQKDGNNQQQKQRRETGSEFAKGIREFAERELGGKVI